MSQSAELSSGQLNPCEQAGIAAEQTSGLPSGLLLAIGRVESGRWDSARNRVTAWPWAINAAGKGQWFDTKDGATETVRVLLGGGTRSIDVGCFQISLLYHPAAFTSLEQAFDPDANARYAARFLLSLFSQTGTWEAAVAAYHSADPALGFPYRQQVFAAWSGAGHGHAHGHGRVRVRPMGWRGVAIPGRSDAAGDRRRADLDTDADRNRVRRRCHARFGGEHRGSRPPMGGDGIPLPAVSYRIPAGILPGR